MRKLLLSILLLLASGSLFAQHRLEKLWESDSLLVRSPESAFFDPKTQTLFVSGTGSGTVVQMGLDGKVVKQEWAKGLKGNMGSALTNGLFYTTAPSGLSVIDAKTGAMIKNIPIEGIGMLNDVAADAKGIVYTSDTRTGKIYRVENDKAQLYLENMPGANGLLCIGDDLYVVTSNAVQKFNANKQVTKIADGFENGLDGIVMVGTNEFILSNYQGILYYVNADGTKETLLDTRAGRIMANDISYDSKSKILYVPNYNKNRIVAYQLK